MNNTITTRITTTDATDIAIIIVEAIELSGVPVPVEVVVVVVSVVVLVGVLVVVPVVVEVVVGAVVVVVVSVIASVTVTITVSEIEFPARSQKVTTYVYIPGARPSTEYSNPFVQVSDETSSPFRYNS